jgi:hypothetical protein
MSKEAKAKTEPKEKAPKKEPKRGVGAVAIEAIRAGKTNEETLDIVRGEFPDAKTTLASVNWYRNKLRGDGESVPMARDLKKQAKDAAVAKEADPLG